MNEPVTPPLIKQLVAAIVIAAGAYNLLHYMASFVISNGYWNHSLFLQHSAILFLLAIVMPVYLRFVGPLPLGKIKQCGARWHALAIAALYIAEWLFEKVTNVPQETFMITIFAKPALGIFSTCLIIFLIAPINEEIMFRGLILNVFTQRGRRVFWMGALVSSTLFMLMHSQYQQISTLVEMFIVGMIFCSARWYSGGLLLPILLHIQAAVIAVILG
ncbi:membrane protease YdiL (CAAX protease family) [Pantoea alhagi]|uniref:CPBP family intramembrane glutamic endopeptidase n=1 Tax=Mixta sp. BE291 TaxID=3158787 RepID=UPI002862FA3B|nr:membrane protease YdiL (CAAX protease family) [Pantoea alhagi]